MIAKQSEPMSNVKLLVAFVALGLPVLASPALAGDEAETREEAALLAEEEAIRQLAPPPFDTAANWDSMARILDEQRRIIAENPDSTLVGQAARIVWRTLHMSGIVVLPTAGVDETFEMHRNHVQQLEASIKVLEARLWKGDLAAEAGDSVLEVKVSLEAEADWIQTLGQWTANVRPRTPQARVLNKRQLRSPFVPLPFLHPLHGPEEVVTHDVIGINECMVVVKEIQGMKVRLVAKILPVWVEPWSSRRRIVGTKVVWCVEYVPAQFIKKVVTCNDCCNEIKNEIFTEIIEHPELLHFWRFFKKGYEHHSYGPYGRSY